MGGAPADAFRQISEDTVFEGKLIRVALGDFVSPSGATITRELVEEIGLRPRALELLAGFYNSAGFTDEYCYVYLATEFDAATAEAHGEEEEHMTVEHVPLAEIDAMIADGRLRDAKSIIGLLLAMRRLGR